MKHTGLTDVPLTDVGREQAQALAPRLQEREFARVLVSPLSRAVVTCELAGFGDRAERRDELIEVNYGDYEGLTTKTIREDIPGWTVWTHGSKGGESPDDVGARLDPLVAELKEGDGDVAVFAHGHVLRILTARWLELPAADGRLFALGTGTLSTLGWERETAVIKVWNA
jgi:probable phosphoglycerate mutase